MLNTLKTWIVNVLYTVDCLLAITLAIFLGSPGVRWKTLSAWIGQAHEGHFGKVWWYVAFPVYMLNSAHFDDAARPYLVTANED